MKNRLKFGLAVGYIIFLIGGSLLVKQTLKDGDLKVTTREKKVVEDTRPAKVTVKVLMATCTGSYVNKEFSLSLTNKNTVSEALKKLRDNDSIFFETNLTTSGSKIIDFKVLPDADCSSSKLNIYMDGKNITDKIDKTYFSKDDSVVTITDEQLIKDQ